MHPTLQLLLLLVCMVLGNNVVGGSRRMVRDTVVALAVWIGVLAAIGLIMMRPHVSVWSIKAGLGFAALYGIVYLVRRILHGMAPTPWLPPPKRRHVRRLLVAAGYSRATARAAFAADADRTMLGIAAIAACTTRPEESDLAGFMVEEIAAQQKVVDTLMNEIRGACGEEFPGNAPFAAGLLLRYGAETVRKALRAVRREAAATPRATRRRLLAELEAAAVPAMRGAALSRMGVHVAVESDDQSSPWRRLRGARLVASVLLPTYAYVALGRPGRAGVFTVCYGVPIAYGIILLSGGFPAGWVFLAVAAQLHMSALFNLAPTCRTDLMGAAADVK